MTEFRKALRLGMKVTQADVPDADVTVLIRCLDGDGGGDLSIREIAEFIERGAEMFEQCADDDDGPPPISINVASELLRSAIADLSQPVDGSSAPVPSAIAERMRLALLAFAHHNSCIALWRTRFPLSEGRGLQALEHNRMANAALRILRDSDDVHTRQHDATPAGSPFEPNWPNPAKFVGRVASTIERVGRILAWHGRHLDLPPPHLARPRFKGHSSLYRPSLHRAITI